MTQPDDQRTPGDEPDADQAANPAGGGDAIVPPDDWYSNDVGAADAAAFPVPMDGGPAAPPPPPSHAGSRGEQAPAIEGVAFDRHTEHNSRAIVGMVLSGLGLVGGLAWFAGFSTPLLLVVGLGIGGIVMGLRGRAAARNGLATNGGLALAAAIVGLVDLLAVVAVFALLVIAVSQLT